MQITEILVTHKEKTLEERDVLIYTFRNILINIID